MTTSDSAQVTPTSGSPVAVHPAERLGVRSPAAVRAERRAWLVIWLAFLTFCALVFSMVKFALDYVSTAEIDQSAFVTGSSGLVFVTSPGSSDKTSLETRNELGVGTVIAPDRFRSSSVNLTLFDQSKLTLHGGATVELARMEVGRFISQHLVILNQSTGSTRYATAGPLQVQVPNGLVQLAAHGDYTVWIDGDTTRVLVYGGEARLSASGTNATITEGHRGEIDAQRQLKGPLDRGMPLLANGDFVKHDENWLPLDVSQLDVNGQRLWVNADETGTPSTALRITRTSAKQEHGETGLIQKLNQDVSGFRHLWLRALVRVDYADLAGGGQLNSEYPMMLRMQYEGPVENSRPDWLVGFYYLDGRPVPPDRARLWPQGEWQPYEVDLMQTEPSSVPYRLLELDVMGQGHSYDARITNIELIGD